MSPRCIFRSRGIRWTAALLIAGATGCAATQKPKSHEFFTSGDREADQRADQRMSKAEQLHGSGEGAGDTSADQKKSLYDRLGGESKLVDIVDDFVPRLLADPRVNFQRKGVQHGGFTIHHWKSESWDASADNVKQLKVHFVQFLSLATGGPSKYEGTDMRGAHAHMHISNPEFDAALGDLKASLDKLLVGNKEQKELLAVVESTREQIVEER